MEPVLAIGFWAALFIGSHLLISSAKIRPRLVRISSAQLYRGVYSVVALATFVPLVVVFANHRHAGPILWYLRGEPPIRWLAWLMMLIALIVLIAGFANPNPGSIGAQSSNAVTGVLKITRHPSFVALSLFGFAHMLMNGWLGDLIFFGTFPVLGIVGALHQDHRKLRELGESYREFVAQTSIIPGIALLQGRQRWTSADNSWTAVGAGAAATLLLLVFHPRLFGGNPLG
jgi:uncharacterized membrane protein